MLELDHSWEVTESAAPPVASRKPVPAQGAKIGQRATKLKDGTRICPERAWFLWESCQEEIRKGWAFPFMRQDEVDLKFPHGWAGVPTFAHVQPSGKLRRIDSARRGKQNSAVRYVKRMRMCTAFHPAAVAKALVNECLQQGLQHDDLRLDCIESWSEDISDAYRMLPVLEMDLPANVVMVKHPQTGRVQFVIMGALLFGFSASVMQFARWSRFLEAFARRVLALMWAMYVDDSNIIDFASGKGSAQKLGRDIFGSLGVPLAEHHRARPWEVFIPRGLLVHCQSKRAEQAARTHYRLLHTHDASPSQQNSRCCWVCFAGHVWEGRACCHAAA